MTLLLTEIGDKGVVFAADRNLTWYDESTGQIGGLAFRRRKILGIEHLSGAIGYFGNAHVGRAKTLMDEWLESFIIKSADCADLEEFAHRLRDALQSELTQEQSTRGLGLHMAAMEEHEDLMLPTFWYVSNIKGMKGPLYTGVRDYFRASEHFLRRDVRFVKPAMLDEYLATHGARVYRNGTLPLYVVAARHIYSLFRTTWALREKWKMEEFRPPQNLAERAELARSHIDITTEIYERFSSAVARPIGGGVDIITISRDGNLICDYCESSS